VKLYFAYGAAHDADVFAGNPLKERFGSHVPILPDSPISHHPVLLLTDEMIRPVSGGMLYAPKFIDVLEAQEIKETGNEED
jgi:hypothetical protein